jgi:hypothetical protein
MEPLSARVRIAIFVLAVVCTAGLAYAAVKGMQWALANAASLGDASHPIARAVGVLVIAIIVGLRFYVRRRAKLAQKKS